MLAGNLQEQLRGLMVGHCGLHNQQQRSFCCYSGTSVTARKLMACQCAGSFGRTHTCNGPGAIGQTRTDNLERHGVLLH